MSPDFTHISRLFPQCTCLTNLFPRMFHQILISELMFSFGMILSEDCLFIPIKDHFMCYHTHPKLLVFSADTVSVESLKKAYFKVSTPFNNISSTPPFDPLQPPRHLPAHVPLTTPSTIPPPSLPLLKTNKPFDTRTDCTVHWPKRLTKTIYIWQSLLCFLMLLMNFNTLCFPIYISCNYFSFWLVKLLHHIPLFVIGYNLCSFMAFTPVILYFCNGVLSGKPL